MNKELLTALILLGVASVYLYNIDPSITEVSSFDSFKRDFGKTYTKDGE